MKDYNPSKMILLVGGIIFLIIIVLGGYSFLDFQRIITRSNHNSSLSVRRDSLITSTQSMLEEMAELFEVFQMHSMHYDSIGREFDKRNKQILSMKSEYLSLINDIQDSVGQGIVSKAKVYFSRVDLLLEQIGKVFEQSTIVDLQRRENESVRAQRTGNAIISNLGSQDFVELLQAEHRYSNEQELLRSRVTNLHTLRWFISSLAFISFIMILSYLLISRERRISSEARRFQVLLEHSTNPALITDNNGLVRYANPAFINWIGVESSSLLTQNLFNRMKTIKAGGHGDVLWTLARPVLVTGKAWNGEVELQRVDGRVIISNLILSPVIDDRGKFTECIALHSDLTEQKQFARKIIETQQQYRNIVESSLDGIIVLLEGRLVYVNPSAINIFGYVSAEEMKMINFNDIIAPQYRSMLIIEFKDRVMGEEVFRSYEMRGITKQGKMIDIEANAHVIEWNDQPALQVSFRDITERKILEREQALWLWEQETLSEIDRKLVGVIDLEKSFAAMLQQTLNLTHAHFGGVLLLDETRTQVQWKVIQGNSCPYFSGYFVMTDTLRTIIKKEEPCIMSTLDTSPQHELASLDIIRNENLLSVALFPLIVEGECNGILVIGFRTNHEFVGREIRLLTSLAEKHSIAMVNAQLYNELLQREKELEILTGARVQAQEEERKRIAREIHDGLGQMLTAIKFNLEILEDMISVGEEERKRISDMKELLDSVMKEARELSYNLMPSVLDDFGLVPALQLLSEQFASRSNLKVTFQSHRLRERLDPQVEIGLYRIAQESLNNVAKHAEATEINLQVIRHTEGIRLVIEDNGKGILHDPNVDRTTAKSGMGLISMRERASSFGGTITIDSTPGRGTLIAVDIPLKEHTTHE